MRSSAALAVAALLLLAFAPLPSHAAASNSIQGLLGLGYGPLSIQPASRAVPVFAPGDNLWVQSYSNSSAMTLILAPPNGSDLPAVELPAGALAKIYTFPSNGSVGEWTLDAYLGDGVAQIGFSVRNASALQPPALESVGLSKGDLVLGYSVANTTAYGMQACLMGPPAGGTSTFQLPPSIGGSLTVSLNGSSVSAFAPQAQQPVSAWFQLYTPRTYLTAAGLVTYDTMAGETQAVTVGASAEPVAAPMTTYLSLRSGPYDLRSYVRTSAAISTYDTQYLLVNGSAWVSLGGCSQLTPVLSGSFQLSAPLNGSASSWPTTLLMTYNYGGIESFTLSGAPATETRIDLGNATQAVVLGKVGVTVSGSGVADFAAYEGSAYFIARSFPVAASVALNFENVTTVSFPVSVSGPRQVESIQPSVGTVDALAVSAGVPISNATVTVQRVGAQPAHLKTGKGGAISLVLPPGEYNFTMTYDGSTVSQVVQVSSGQTTDVTLSPAAAKFPLLTVALGAILAAGAVADVLVWRAYLLRRRALR